MATVAFLGVDQEDQALVTEQYPDALVLPENLQDGDVLEQCADVEVLSVFIYSQVGQAELAAMPNLKLLCTRSVGFDHINLNACTERGITVCNVPDYGSFVIAEHVFALLLSTVRHIPTADKRVEGGTFDYHGLRGMALAGKTLGIVGTGKIGRHVANIAQGFGMKILAVDVCRSLELEESGVRYAELDELLAESDIITLHVPALPETEHMINTESLSKTKPGVILINTARGSLIDSSALLSALESGHLGYALLDVLEHEKNFEENQALIKHERVVSTPHIAFYADESMKNMYLDCFESIAAWQQGKESEHRVQPVKKVCDLPGIKQ